MSIQSAGVSARGTAAEALRVPAGRLGDAQAARARDLREPVPATAPLADSDDDAGVYTAASRGRTVTAERVMRVDRLDDQGAMMQTNRGVAAYLGVERGTVTDPSGGELMGIDFYV